MDNGDLPQTSDTGTDAGAENSPTTSPSANVLLEDDHSGETSRSVENVGPIVTIVKGGRERALALNGGSEISAVNLEDDLPRLGLIISGLTSSWLE